MMKILKRILGIRIKCPQCGSWLRLRVGFDARVESCAECGTSHLAFPSDAIYDLAAGYGQQGPFLLPLTERMLPIEAELRTRKVLGRLARLGALDHSKCFGCGSPDIRFRCRYCRFGYCQRCGTGSRCSACAHGPELVEEQQPERTKDTEP
jgi:hypothetical protein